MNGAGGSVFDELAQSVFGALRERFTVLEQENRDLQARLAGAEESNRRLEADLQQRGAAIEAMQAGLRASAEQALGSLEESYQRIVEQQKAQQDQFEQRLRSVHGSMEGLFGLFQQEQSAILQQLTGDLSRDLAEVSEKGQSDLVAAIDNARSRFLCDVANIVDGSTPAPAIAWPGEAYEPASVEGAVDEPVDEMEVHVEMVKEDAPGAPADIVEMAADVAQAAPIDIFEQAAGVAQAANEAGEITEIAPVANEDEGAVRIAQAADDDEAEEAETVVEPTSINDYIDRAEPAAEPEVEETPDSAVPPFLPPVVAPPAEQAEPRSAAPVIELVTPGEYLPIDGESVLPAPPSWDLRTPVAPVEEIAAEEETVAGPAMAVEARRGRPMSTSRMIVSPFPNFTSLIRFEAALKQIEAIRRFRSRNFRSGRFEVTFDHDPEVSIVDAILNIPDHRLELVSSGEDSYAFRLQG